MATNFPDPSEWVETADGWDVERHYAERRENGFSKADWINFETYLAWIIASGVQRLKDEGHTMFSFPGEPEEKWEELTNTEYDVMINGFGNYADTQMNPSARTEWTKVDNDLEAALETFKKRFRSLWD